MIKVFFAQKAFIVHEGCLLAVRKSANDPNHPLKWEVPGGRLELGEALEEGLCREVFEEVGIRVIPSSPFYVWKWTISGRLGDEPDTVVAVARFCTAATTKLSDRGRKSDDFLGEVLWVPLCDVAAVDWIPNMLPVVEAFLLQQQKDDRL